MRKNILSVIEAFKAGKVKHERSCSTDGTNIRSYAVIIAKRNDDGTIWVDDTGGWSRTTTGQIRACQYELLGS